VSKLALDSRSEEREVGIGGTFIEDNFVWKCSTEDRLRRERLDGFLRKLRSVSLLFFELMKLIRRGEGLTVGLLALGVCEPSSLAAPSWLICEDLEVLLEWTGAGTDIISVTVIAFFVNGDRLRFFSIRLGSPAVGAGEGDLEVEDRKDLRAMLRIVPVTDRPGPLAVSFSSAFCCLGSVLVVSSCSLSAGRLNLALPNLFFAFLDALRKSSLFAT
jgi:hypothetical protein